MIFLKYIFDFLFHWKGIYYGQLYYKTCLRILISPSKPQKTAKNVDFENLKITVFNQNWGIFNKKVVKNHVS